MSTRSQKRRNFPQESSQIVSESMVTPIVVENESSADQDVLAAGPSRAKYPRVENSSLGSLRASLKEEITSEFKTLLAEFRRELLKLLKPKPGECVIEEVEASLKNEEVFTTLINRSEYITQNNDPGTSRNSSKR